jgi:hypothetical protein
MTGSIEMGQTRDGRRIAVVETCTRRCSKRQSTVGLRDEIVSQELDANCREMPNAENRQF